MSIKKYQTLRDVPADILVKYRAGRYWFSPPPVYCSNWTELDWINFIGDGWMPGPVDTLDISKYAPERLK